MVSYPNKRCGLHPGKKSPYQLIRPWKVKVNGQQVEFNALTYIDMTLNLVKLIRVINKTAKHIRDKFRQSVLVDTIVLYNVYITKEANSFNRTFNGYWKSLALRMYAQPAKIHNLMQSVKGCIRQ